MKKLFIFPLFLIYSCTIISSNMDFYGCLTKASNYDKAIVNINTDSMIVVDAFLGGNVNQSIRDMISEYASKELFEQFPSLPIVINQPCTERAILLDGKVIIFQHNQSRIKPQRNKFEGKMKGRLIRCSDGKILLTDNFSATNRDYLDTPQELGESFGKFATRELKSCQ